MKRMTGMAMLAAVLGGCVTTGTDPYTGGHGGPYTSGHGGCPEGTPLSVPGVQGPWGSPVPMCYPYAAAPPSPGAAYAMMSRSVPLDRLQMAGSPGPNMSSGVVQASAALAAGAPSGVVQAGGSCPPGGCPPAMMPPGGAISPPGVPFGPGMPGMPAPGPGAVAALGALTGNAPSRFATRRTEVRFVQPTGMKVAWPGVGTNGQGVVTSQLEVPGRYNFMQAATYRLKLGDIPNRPGLELYPSLEVVPSNVKTDTFLAHSAVPVSFTEEDFEQVAAGNFVVKVIYLPDPQFQELAATGLGEIVSTRLEPGVDPIAEAYRRGSILLIVRLGNIDLEAPNTPAMDAPSPYAVGGPVLPGTQGVGPACPVPVTGAVPPGANAAGKAIASPNGPMMASPNGPMMANPNGPMMANPNGPMMANPNGPMMAGPSPAFLAGRSGMVPPSGTMTPPPGTGMGPNGMPYGPGGMMMPPPGTLVGPNGMLIGPNGPMLPPRGVGMANTPAMPGAMMSPASGMLPPSLPVQPPNPLAIPGATNSSAAPMAAPDRAGVQLANFPDLANPVAASIMAARAPAPPAQPAATDAPVDNKPAAGSADGKKPSRFRRWLWGMKDDAPNYPDPFDAAAKTTPKPSNGNPSPQKEPDSLPLSSSSGSVAQGDNEATKPFGLAAQSTLAPSVPMTPDAPSTPANETKKLTAADQWMLGVKSFEPLP